MVEKPTRSIAGKIALITGAGSGMGRAAAELFAREGAHVAAIDINEPNVRAVAEGIAQTGGSVLALRVDVADHAAIKQAVAQTVEQFGGIDILLNIAGHGALCAIDGDGYDDLWDGMIAVHLTAHQRFVRAALPYLRQSSSGRIVNYASTEALGSSRADSAYAAAKGGVTALTRSLAVDLGRDGITVNCICPGPIDTPLIAVVPAEDKVIFAKRRTSLGRYGTAEEVADVTLSLCLPTASYITGATIPVDGGLSTRLM